MSERGEPPTPPQACCAPRRAVFDLVSAVQQSHKSCAIAIMAALSCQLGQPCVVVVSDVLSSVEEVVSKANSLLRPLDPKFDGLSPVLHFCTGASKTWNFTRMEFRGIKTGGLVPVLQASKAVLKHLNELADSSERSDLCARLHQPRHDSPDVTD